MIVIYNTNNLANSTRYHIANVAAIVNFAFVLNLIHAGSCGPISVPSLISHYGAFQLCAAWKAMHVALHSS